mgnify:CR=1 FL=1
MKSHIIGVIIGLSLAVIALFSINFFIAQEHIIEEEIVIKSLIYQFESYTNGGLIYLKNKYESKL